MRREQWSQLLDQDMGGKSSLTRHCSHRKAWCAPGTGLRLDVSGAHFILTTASGVGRSYSYSFHTAKEKGLIQGHLLCKWQSQDLTWCPLKIVRYVKPTFVWNPINILLHSEQGMYANRCVSVYFSVVKRSLSPCCPFLSPNSLKDNAVVQRGFEIGQT